MGITTYTGKHFDPLRITPEMICKEDIAHSHSLMGRFAGHSRIFYSIGSHTICGAKWFLKQKRYYEAKCFLLHEVEESVVMDMPTDIKYLPQMKPYRTLGKGIQKIMLWHFGIYDIPKSIKELDSRMSLAEARVLFDPIPDWALTDVDTSDIKIEFKSMKAVEKEWLTLYDKIENKLKGEAVFITA